MNIKNRLANSSESRAKYLCNSFTDFSFFWGGRGGGLGKCTSVCGYLLDPFLILFKKKIDYLSYSYIRYRYLQCNIVTIQKR